MTIDIVIGLCLGIVITGAIVWLLPFHGREPRRWVPQARVPQARVSKIADARLDVGEAIKRGDRTWRP